MKTSKQEILKTATYFFIKKGYNGTSLADISSAVGIRKGSLFSHIKSKENLYQDVLNVEIPTINFKQEKYSLQELIEIYIQKLQQEISRLNNLFDNDISLTDYMLFLLESSKRHQNSKKRIENNSKKEIETWVNCLQKAKEKGEIKATVDVNLNAQLFYYVFFGNFYLSAISNELNTEQLKKSYYQLYDTLRK
ncbi:MAG: TetR/AcrR family transcriptional regulator [Paludibacteraceae bacterium]|nr:TetR/AcrR family transcriptional regulator [Paludibacteraceae bacterium]